MKKFAKSLVLITLLCSMILGAFVQAGAAEQEEKYLTVSEISDTDLFYGYPWYLIEPFNAAGAEISKRYSETLEEFSLGHVLAATWESSMESFGDMVETTKIVLGSLGFTYFMEKETSEAAAMAILKSYYSDEIKGEAAMQSMAKNYSEYMSTYNDIIKLAQDLEEVRPEGVSDESWFWQCFDRICAAVKSGTGCDLSVPTEKRDAFWEHFRDGADVFENVLKFIEVLLKWHLIGEFEVELLDEIIANEYVEAELKDAFVRIKKDIKNGWLVYVTSYFLKKSAVKEMCDKVEDLFTSTILPSNFFSYVDAWKFGVGIVEWIVFDAITDSASVQDWMTSAYIGYFYYSMRMSINDKIFYILNNPTSSREIDDLGRAFQLYNASLTALMESSAGMGMGDKESLQNQYVLSFDSYIQKCKENMTLVPESQLAERIIDSSKSYKLSGKVYISESAPSEECDYWIKPFRGEIQYPVELYGTLNIVTDAIIPEMYFGHGNLYLHDCTVDVNSDMTIGGSLHLNNGTLNLNGDLKAGIWQSSPEVFCEKGILNINGSCDMGYRDGSLISTYYEGDFCVEKGKVTIGGALNNCVLKMEDEEGYILVEGECNINNNHDRNKVSLTAGTLEVKGDCSIESGSNVKVGGTHKTIFSGTDVQDVSGKYAIVQLATPNVRNYYNISMSVNEIEGEIKSNYLLHIKGLNFTTNRTIEGESLYLTDCSIADNVSLTVESNCYIRGDIDFGDNVELTVNGKLSIESDTYLNDASINAESLTANSNLHCEQGELNIVGDCSMGYMSGALISNYYESDFYIEKGKVTIGGALKDCILKMDDEEGYLLVEGECDIDNPHDRNNSKVTLTAGTLEVKGKCEIQSGSNVEIGGTHKTIFSGTDRQDVSVPKSPIIIIENESEQGVVFLTAINPTVLFDHRGNNYTLKSASSFVDYDGDGLLDNVDPEPTVGNPCTIVFKSNNEELGSVSIESIETVGGTEISVEASLSEKSVLKEWIDQDGNIISTSQTCKFVAKGDATITAVFAKRSRPIKTECSNGIIVVPDSAEIESEVKVTVVENDGYVLVADSITCNGNLVTGSAFIMPDEEVILRAECVRNEWYFVLKDKIDEANELLALDVEYTADSVITLKTVIEKAESNLYNAITEDECSTLKEELEEAMDEFLKANIRKVKYLLNGEVYKEDSFNSGGITLIDAPELDSGEFVGWTDGVSLYRVGDTYNLTGDTTFEAVVLDIYMTEGASVRLNAQNSGIRFTTNIGREGYDLLEMVAANLTVGTIIVPTDYIPDGKLSLETPKVVNILNGAKDDISWKNITAAAYSYGGSLVNILPNNYIRNFSGIGYVTVEYADGSSATFYAPYETSNVRSIEYVACRAYDDTKKDYKDWQKKIIKGYIDGVVKLSSHDCSVISPDSTEYEVAYTTTYANGTLTISAKSGKEWNASAVKCLVVDGKINREWTVEGNTIKLPFVYIGGSDDFGEDIFDDLQN